jgi:tetratricopeptide (TPR) repeat protein
VWLIELPMALAWRGLVDEAVKAGDALAELDQDNEATFANDVAAILAEAGRGDEALRRVEQNLHRFPDDLWTQFHAGDVHLALSDRSRAEQAFRDALAMARAHGDASGIADANERLVRLLAGEPGREQEANAAAQVGVRVEAPRVPAPASRRAASSPLPRLRGLGAPSRR